MRTFKNDLQISQTARNSSLSINDINHAKSSKLLPLLTQRNQSNINEGEVEKLRNLNKFIMT